jgi:hypothetical protein
VKVPAAPGESKNIARLPRCEEPITEEMRVSARPCVDAPALVDLMARTQVSHGFPLASGLYHVMDYMAGSHRIF